MSILGVLPPVKSTSSGIRFGGWYCSAIASNEQQYLIISNASRSSGLSLVFPAFLISFLALLLVELILIGIFFHPTLSFLFNSHCMIHFFNFEISFLLI